MHDVAQRVGIRKASLFHHFASKDELYLECLASVVDAIGRHMMQAHEVPDSPLAQIDRSTVDVQHFLVANPFTARFLLRELLDGCARLRSNCGDLLDGVLANALQLLRGLMDAGIIPRENAGHLAATALAVHFFPHASPHLALPNQAENVRALIRRLLDAKAVVGPAHVKADPPLPLAPAQTQAAARKGVKASP